MPAPQVACCGLKVAAKPEDWMALVPDDAANAAYLRQELRLLHASFAQAPLLGSLLDPARSLKNDLATSSFDTLRDLLGRALATERPATLWGQASELQDDSWDLAHRQGPARCGPAAGWALPPGRHQRALLARASSTTR
jgi:hypothetical protein